VTVGYRAAWFQGRTKRSPFASLADPPTCKPGALQRGHRGTRPDPGEPTSPGERRAAEGKGPHAAPCPTWGCPRCRQHRPNRAQQGNLTASLEQGKGTEPPCGSSPGTSTARPSERPLLSPNVKPTLLRAGSSGPAWHPQTPGICQGTSCKEDQAPRYLIKRE